MRAAMAGVIVGASLVWAALWLAPDRSQVQAQAPAATAGGAALPSGGSAGQEIIAFTSSVGDKQQQLLVLDPRQRVLGVYHIDTQSGQIALKSVRQIHWDLQIAEFNCVAPLPREVRLMLDRR